MNLDEILIAWQRAKLGVMGRRLDAPCTTEFEFKGKQVGHPSTYAFVRFDCAPSETLTFEVRAQWPSHLAADYCRNLESAMGAAIVDALIASDVQPHVGCSLVCTELRWDDIGSSEVAFYRATEAAMTRLRDEQTWTLRLTR